MLSLSLLLMSALAAPPPAPPQDSFSGVERIVAVGDVHGDLEAFQTILRSAGIIDKKGKWSGGKTHLVQTGDLLDRGPDSRKAMDFLMSLETQAAKAGGRVHALIGNHEAMNIYGDLRYTSPEEFAAFRTSDSEQNRTLIWEQTVRTLPSKPTAEFRKQWDAEHPLGWVEHRLAFAPQGTYGKWLRTHNAIVKINDALFLHGGLSPEMATLSITEMNEAIRARLSDLTLIRDNDIVTGDTSPLWYRGLTRPVGDELAPHVDQMLAKHSVKYIVLGHTPTEGQIEQRFGGKVILIDVGMAKYYSRRGSACLVLENGSMSVIDRGVRAPLNQP
jgi:hypothetical protein